MNGVPSREVALAALRNAHAGFLTARGRTEACERFYSVSVPGYFYTHATDDVTAVDLRVILENWRERPASAWLYEVRLFFVKWLTRLGYLEPVNAEEAEIALMTHVRITAAGLAALAEG